MAHADADSAPAMPTASLGDYLDCGRELERTEARIVRLRAEMETLERARVGLLERMRALSFELDAASIAARTAPQRRRRQRGETRRLVTDALPGTVAEIAERTGVTVGAVRVTLRSLERGGLVTRDEVVMSDVGMRAPLRFSRVEATGPDTSD